MNLPLEQIATLVRYDPETGKFWWLPRGSHRFDGKWAGREAFASCDAYGYRQGVIMGKAIKPHRLAFAITHARWPIGEIDHVNGDRQDNRIANLREVTPSENRRNMRPRRELPLGVYRLQQGRWRAIIKVGGVEHRLGIFSTVEAAIAARKAAETAHGFHPNHGCSVEDLLTEGKAA